MTKAGFHTVTIREETYQKLESARKTQGLHSIAETIAELVKA